MSRLVTPKTYIAADWAGNVLFNAKEFKSFEDAWDFVYENSPEDDWQDIYVLESRGTRESRYLDPRDPRSSRRVAL